MVKDSFIKPLKLTYIIGYVYIFSALFLILTSFFPQLTSKSGVIGFLGLVVMFWSALFGGLALFCVFVIFVASKQKPPRKFWWMLAVVAMLSVIIVGWM